MRALPWDRPEHAPTDARQRVHLVAAFDGPPAVRGAPEDLRGWCPVDTLAGVAFGVDEDAWAAPFGQWVQGRGWTDHALAPSLRGPLGHMTTAWLVEADGPDVADLTLLQAAWAAARWCVDGGAFAVYDVGADRWWAADDVAAWGDHRPLSVPREVRHERFDAHTATFWLTRGHAKFARPDVLLHVPEGLDPQDPLRLLASVSARLAGGAVLGPGDAVHDGFAAGTLLAFRPGVVDLDLPPDSLVLLPQLPDDPR